MCLSNYKWILAEVKFLNWIGWPTAIGFFSDAFQIQISTVLVGHTSSLTIAQLLNGLFVGQSIYVITSLIFLQGITAGMSALCGQALGASDYRKASIYFYRAFLLALLTCFPIWALWIKVEALSYYLLGDSVEARYAGQYTTIVAFGYPANLFYRLAYGFLQAQNRVAITTLFFVFSTSLNLISQYVFIFIFELEALGVAMAYVLSVNFVALQFYTYIRFTDIHKKLPSFWSIDVLDDWIHFFNYGIAGMIQFLTDTIERRIIPIIVIGSLAMDSIQLAVYTILNVFWFLLATLTLGLSTAVTVRVGNLLGEAKPAESKRAATFSLVISAILFISLGVALIIISPWMGQLFTWNPELILRLPLAFRVLGIVLIGDICYIIRGVMNGCGLQNINTFVNFVSIVIFGGTLECLGGYYLEWRDAACYMMMGIGMVIAAVICLFIIYCSSWEKLSANVIKNLDIRPESVSIHHDNIISAEYAYNDIRLDLNETRLEDNAGTDEIVVEEKHENLSGILSNKSTSIKENNEKGTSITEVDSGNKIKYKIVRLFLRYTICMLIGIAIFIVALIY